MNGVNGAPMAAGPWIWKPHENAIEAPGGKLIARVWSDCPGDGATIAKLPELLAEMRECAAWLKKEAAEQGPQWTTLAKAVVLNWVERLEGAAGEGTASGAFS